MAQQVTITSDTQVALKPLLESALRSELRTLDLSLQRTAEHLRTFEQQYGMTSAEFEQRFHTGQLKESLDFIEWSGEIQTYRLLEVHRQALQGARLS